MIDYEPLWESLKVLNRSPYDLVTDGVLNSRTLSNMRKGRSVTLSTIEKICVHYGLPIEKVVAIHID